LPSGDERYPQAIDPDSPDAINLLKSIRFVPSQRIRTQMTTTSTSGYVASAFGCRAMPSPPS
jgi:hypothetical protein